MERIEDGAINITSAYITQQYQWISVKTPAFKAYTYGSVMSGLFEAIKNIHILKMVDTMPKCLVHHLDYYMKEYKLVNYRVFAGETTVI